MADINFYHLTAKPLEWALPKLLEKAMETGAHSLVLAASEERVEALNSHLWTYEQRSWLPHGSKKDGMPEEQPIWLSAEDDNPNDAEFLFLTDGATTSDLSPYRRVFELFDGRDEQAVIAARDRWRTYKEDGHDLAYWKQDDNGRWEKAS